MSSRHDQEDQAGTLRRLMLARVQEEPLLGAEAPSARVITLASGNGGVGKSCLVANLGAALARSGLRVMLVDGDLGPANLDILLGLPGGGRAGTTLKAVIEGRARLQDAIVAVEPNLWLIPAGAGFHELRQAGPDARLRLMKALDTYPWEMDVILLDAGAGIGPGVLSLHSPAFESLVVLTPEPTSLADAYSLIRTLRWSAGVGRCGVVVNKVTDGRQGQAVFRKLQEIASRFIDTQLEYLGHLQRDEKFTQAMMKRKILLDLDGGAPSAACIELLAKRISSGLQATRHGRAASQERGALRQSQGQGQTARSWRTLLGEVRT